MLDIVSRQHSLNFTPGSQYSYSNSGYNLAAIIVSRVSGKTFAEFSQERLFKPLGMTHTSWRDDFTRIVRNRAIAYSEGRDGQFQMDMPFENVHGNGGLLTTVGDLLKWNENFVSPKVGDPAFVREQQETGRFNDGRPQQYALGLVIGQYRGLRNVSHGGATAGYRAYLVALSRSAPIGRRTVQCIERHRHAVCPAVADMYLGFGVEGRAAAPAAPQPGPKDTFHPTAKELGAFAGTYSSDEAETTFVAAMDGETLVLKRRPDTVLKLRPTTTDTFAAQPLGIVKFLRDTAGRVNGMSVSRDRVFDMRFTRTQ